MTRYFAIIFLALAVGITFVGREGFFRTALYEEGDNAANALQIFRAKSFRELHGNYSRWGFHHPGPAFFYVDAAGEWLLHDVLGVTPAPGNAHIYASTLLQLAFYAAALALLASHARQPWLALALGILAGAAHYLHVERPLFSVWPPDVLLMPFLCFMVAAAAVASGDRKALPVLVIAASFLVHGHVAQPLFVLPLTALALWLAWRGDVRGNFRAALRSGPGRAALVLFALFVLPLALDLFAGRRSNAYSILLHLRFQTDAGQTLWQSILCYAAYFFAIRDPWIFNDLTPSSYEPFREHAWVLAGWALALAFVVAWLWRRRGAAGEPPADARFGRRLMLFWLGGSLLTLVWGMRQDGGFTSFNSLFNHSLVHVVALAAVLGLVHVLPATSHAFGRCATAAALFVFALALPFYPPIGSRGDEATVKLRGLLQADPKPHALKLITFSADDWYEAVTLARAFQRLAIPFAVHPSWEIMFGPDKLFNDAAALGRGDVSIWHLVGPKRAPQGAHILNRECSVVFPTGAPVLPLPARVDFGQNDHQRYLTYGLSGASEGWIWTEGTIAGFTFDGPAVAGDVAVTLQASGFVTQFSPRGQRATLLVNGERIGAEETFTEELREARWSVPQEIWNRRSPRTLFLELPDAISPAAAGRSGDRRQLGLRLHRLELTPRE